MVIVRVLVEVVEVVLVVVVLVVGSPLTISWHPKVMAGPITSPRVCNVMT